MKISAIYIAKNEAKTIARSLDSIKDAADELILVDTGSTDDTIKIFQSYGGRVYHQPWQNDFSAARNLAISKASGDWLIVLNADEYFTLETQSNIRRILNAVSDKCLALNIKNYSVDEASGEIQDFIYDVRIVRNVSQLNYKGIVCERMYIKDKPLVEYIDAPEEDLTLISTGYSKGLRLENLISLYMMEQSESGYEERKALIQEGLTHYSKYPELLGLLGLLQLEQKHFEDALHNLTMAEDLYKDAIYKKQNLDHSYYYMLENDIKCSIGLCEIMTGKIADGLNRLVMMLQKQPYEEKIIIACLDGHYFANKYFSLGLVDLLVFLYGKETATADLLMKILAGNGYLWFYHRMAQAFKHSGIDIAVNGWPAQHVFLEGDIPKTIGLANASCKEFSMLLAVSMMNHGADISRFEEKNRLELLPRYLQQVVKLYLNADKVQASAEQIFESAANIEDLIRDVHFIELVKVLLSYGQEAVVDYWQQLAIRCEADINFAILAKEKYQPIVSLDNVVQFLEADKYDIQMVQEFYKYLVTEDLVSRIQILNSMYDRQKDGLFLIGALIDLAEPKLIAYYGSNKQLGNLVGKFYLKIGRYDLSSIDLAQQLSINARLLAVFDHKEDSPISLWSRDKNKKALARVAAAAGELIGVDSRYENDSIIYQLKSIIETAQGEGNTSYDILYVADFFIKNSEAVLSYVNRKNNIDILKMLYQCLEALPIMSLSHIYASNIKDAEKCYNVWCTICNGYTGGSSFVSLYIGLLLAVARNDADQVVLYGNKWNQTYDANNEEVHFYLGNAYAYKGEFEKAVEHYQKALSIKSTLKEANYNLQLIQKSSKNIAGRLKEYNHERDYSIDYRDIPIFINSRDRVICLKKLVDWLLQAEYRNIIILDNASTYPDLLTYYEKVEQLSEVRVIRLENVGHTALWTSGVLEKLKINTPYVYTDSDVLPMEGCPKDVLRRMLQWLNKYPYIKKIGLALKIDDITFFDAKKKRAWESRFYRFPLEDGLVYAPVDTTFALYRNIRHYSIYFAARTTGDLMARHLPWYYDYDNLPEDEQYYMEHCNTSSSVTRDAKVRNNRSNRIYRWTGFF